MIKRTKTDTIVLHCAATKASMDIGVEEIKKWHVVDNGWSDIGYHWVIRRDGTIEPGRDQTLVGSHARQVNGTSLGICLVGGKDTNNKPDCNYTLKQYIALKELVSDLKKEYKKAVIVGHRDVADVLSPHFNIKELLR